MSNSAQLTFRSFNTGIRMFGMIAATMLQFGLADAQATSSSRQSCDLAKKQRCENLVQDNILWTINDPENPASKHWLPKNLDDLCACTVDPYATVNCFQVEVNNNYKTWQDAIAICRAKP